MSKDTEKREKVEEKFLTDFSGCLHLIQGKFWETSWDVSVVSSVYWQDSPPKEVLSEVRDLDLFSMY